jgi:hypothetical protein
MPIGAQRQKAIAPRAHPANIGKKRRRADGAVDKPELRPVRM